METDGAVSKAGRRVFPAFKTTAGAHVIRCVHDHSTNQHRYFLGDVISAAGLTVNSTNATRRLADDCKSKLEIVNPQTGGAKHVWTVSRYGLICFLSTVKPQTEEQRAVLGELIGWTHAFLHEQPGSG